MEFIFSISLAYAAFALTLFAVDQETKAVVYSTASAPPYTYVWLIFYILVILPYRRIKGLSA